MYTWSEGTVFSFFIKEDHTIDIFPHWKYIVDLGEEIHPNYVAQVGVRFEYQCTRIYNVQTREEHRGKGYASTLIRHLISIVEKEGWPSTLELACLEELIPFYERLGFVFKYSDDEINCMRLYLPEVFYPHTIPTNSRNFVKILQSIGNIEWLREKHEGWNYYACAIISDEYGNWGYFFPNFCKHKTQEEVLTRGYFFQNAEALLSWLERRIKKGLWALDSSHYPDTWGITYDGDELDPQIRSVLKGE